MAVEQKQNRRKGESLQKLHKKRLNNITPTITMANLGVPVGLDKY